MGSRNVAVVLAVLLTASLAPLGAEGRPSAGPSAALVAKRFQVATGRALAVDRVRSRPGRLTALALSPSVTNEARYGRFVVWVVAPGAEGEVDRLLADTHTGELGAPGPSAIHWERGASLGGATHWLAKKRYGTALVLWWYGDRPKVDARFTRLHRVLVPLAAS